MRILLKWAFGVVALVVTIHAARWLGLEITWPDNWRIIIFVPVLALANAVIGTTLRLLSLPITCLTFGIFGFVVNALVFWIAGAATGATMDFLGALFGSICMTLVSGLLNRTFKET